MKMRVPSILIPRFALSALAILGCVVVIAAGCGTTVRSNDAPLITCTPGNHVYCRCKDREEGTKLCKEDGHSFEPCEPCESPSHPVVVEPPDGPPLPEFDAGRDAAEPGRCGDRVVQDGEDCDDGNSKEDDGCDGKCRLTGANPIASRSCPGMEVHVWSNPVSYVGTTLGSANTGMAMPRCPGSVTGNPTTGAAASDRVFRVTAHRTGIMTVATTNTAYDSFLYVTTSCTPDGGGIPYLACINDVTGPGGETLQFPVTAGNVYSVFVDGAGITQPEGAFRVTFSVL